MKLEGEARDILPQLVGKKFKGVPFDFDGSIYCIGKKCDTFTRQADGFTRIVLWFIRYYEETESETSMSFSLNYDISVDLCEIILKDSNI